MDGRCPGAVGNDIDGAGNGDGRRQLLGKVRRQGAVYGTDEAVDTEVLAALMVGQAGDFRGVAADYRKGQFLYQAQGSWVRKVVPPAPTGSKMIGTPFAAAAFPARTMASKVHC